MKANYHTHAARCRHAQGTEREYVQEAVKAGVSVLGFSDHAPFPDYDFGLRMPYCELREYIDTVDQLTEEYFSDIILYKGLEIEYLPQYRSYYESLLEKEKLDYLLLGEHFYLDSGGTRRNIYFTESTQDYLDYAKAVAEALATGCFRMVAHPDIFAMGAFPWDKNCDEATERIVEAAASSGAVLEFNANGLRRGLRDYPDGRRYMYPHERFWHKVAETNVPVVIGSDCHEASQVWDSCMPASRDMLLGMGITPLEAVEGLGLKTGDGDLDEHKGYRSDCQCHPRNGV